MKWLLVLLCVNINNATDVPGRVTIEYTTQQECEQAITSMTAWLKFDSFKVQAQCVKKS